MIKPFCHQSVSQSVSQSVFTDLFPNPFPNLFLPICFPIRFPIRFPIFFNSICHDRYPKRLPYKVTFWGTECGTVSFKTYGASFDSVHLFIDALSGYCTVIFGHKTDGSKELAAYTERVRKEYQRHGHTIKTLHTDSLSAYQAAPLEDNLTKTGIQRRESAPHEHQQNGQVERYVRSMEEQVTSMRAATPWVPKKFITQQILLWALT